MNVIGPLRMSSAGRKSDDAQLAVEIVETHSVAATQRNTGSAHPRSDAPGKLAAFIARNESARENRDGLRAVCNGLLECPSSFALATPSTT
jgi:hypothetical protein